MHHLMDQLHSERAERIRAMLARWAAEDVGDEPNWDVNDVERMSFSTLDNSPDDSSAELP